jgi:hypothetical protein
MTRVAAILAALALVLLLGISSATGATPLTGGAGGASLPADEYRVYLPIAHNAPFVTVPTALVPCPCGETATPWPTIIPPAPPIMTRTPTP